MFRKTNLTSYSGLLLASKSPAPQCHASARPRLYATASGDSPEKDFSWPSTPSFTPYDVIGHTRGAPYPKHRYYELVKIYHPDRPCNDHPLCRNITPEVRLQRYRIVVTAHEILSDSNRRAAYDATGMGWAFNPAPERRRRNPNDPIYNNATWEDWERWYSRNEPKQETVVDHKTFVMFVVLLFFMGAAVQASWITTVSTGYEDRLKELNEHSTRFLNQRRENTVKQMPGSDAKVQHFLIRRDPSGFGLKGEEKGVYRDALNPLDNPTESGKGDENVRHLNEDEREHPSKSESGTAP
ncbi:J domain-containing protein [Aspergillus mulundensis]|uniref:J domain-containing protein n=1 Tax=Aspergillus mulundensis TaxID=1810919 RepID=A0A3D8SJR3_9EURO|nr:Uncharacterized protein DSM5745_03209 [Aspergillus mulundensis]RDW86567.1 Uncharacterized protein DSM5745_03209 [Aspergillus mulundensis]